MPPFATPGSLCLIGLGALGTELVSRLAEETRLAPLLHGAILIDQDQLETRNIPLSPFFQRALTANSSILGRPKAEVVAELLASHHGCRTRPVAAPFADLSWLTLQPLRLIVSCTDNALARVEASLAARALNLPLLDGGVLGPDHAGGRVTWFSPAPAAACYLCGLSEARRAELLTFASTPSLGCHLPPGTPMGTALRLRVPLQRTAALLVETLQRFFTHPPPASKDLSWATRLDLDRSGWQTTTLNLARDPACPWHQDPPLPLVRIDPDQTFAEALHALSGASARQFHFAWPLCTASRCSHCGATDTHPRRLAAVRAGPGCASCGSPHPLEPLQVLRGIRHNDPVARRTPRQLGWCEPQLLQLRPILDPASRMVPAVREENSP